MKPVIVVCSIGALITALIGLRFLSPVDAQQAYYRAHNEVERIAFGIEGSNELRKAVTDERMMEKGLFVTRDIGRRIIWLSIGFSCAALVFGLLIQEKRQTSNPTQETTRG
jgi:hypothetical protein